MNRNVFTKICSIADTPSAEILLSNIKERFGEKDAENLIENRAFIYSGNKQYIDVIVDDEERSYTVENRDGTLSYFQPNSARWYSADVDKLKVYKVNFDWLLNAVTYALSIEVMTPDCILEEKIWFIGSAWLKRKKAPVIFVRNVNKQKVLEKLDGYLKEKHNSKPALILTTTKNIPAYFKPHGQSRIVMMSNAVDPENNKLAFNITYLSDKIFGYTNEDGFSGSYKALNLKGETYDFTTMQAEAIRFMDEAGKYVPQRDIMEAAGSSQSRLIDLFKGNSARNLIFKSDGKGNYKLININSH